MRRTLPILDLRYQLQGYGLLSTRNTQLRLDGAVSVALASARISGPLRACPLVGSYQDTLTDSPGMRLKSTFTLPPCAKYASTSRKSELRAAQT